MIILKPIAQVIKGHNIIKLIKRFQFFLYPLLVHLSVYLHITPWATCLLPLLFTFYFSPFSFSFKDKENNYTILLKLSILVFLSCLALLSIIYDNYNLIYIPPILIIFTILLPFAISLSPGYIPLITQFYYLVENISVHKESLILKKIRYTFIVTWIWFIVILILLIETILLSLFASVETWSLFTNFINYFFLLALMMVEFLFRSMYFNQWESPLIFIKQLITINHQQLLRKEEN